MKMNIYSKKIFLSLAVFSAVFLLSGCSQKIKNKETRKTESLKAAQKTIDNFPKFEDYPSLKEEYKGKIASINFSHNSGPVPDNLYRTRLKEAIQKGPNFDGRYKIETIGCGASCLLLAIIDVSRGNVDFFPAGVEWPGYIIAESDSIDYRLNSNLIIIKSFDNVDPVQQEINKKCFDDKNSKECLLDKTRYFKWENEKLIEIKNSIP